MDADTKLQGEICDGIQHFCNHMKTQVMQKYPDGRDNLTRVEYVYSLFTHRFAPNYLGREGGSVKVHDFLKFMVNSVASIFHPDKDRLLGSGGGRY